MQDIYLVKGKNTEEDSHFFVAAADPASAARVFLQAVVDEEIAVDAEDLWEGYLIIVVAVPDREAQPQVLKWDEMTQHEFAIPDLDPDFSACFS